MQASVDSHTELRDRLDAELHAFLAGQRTAFDDDWLPLLDEVERVVRAGGKRLRPVFCYWGYIAGGGADSQSILRAAAALELLHTFAIVHDDVMDGSDTRRGQPASHALYRDEALASGYRTDADTFGVSMAVLAGDLALVLADRMLASSGFPPDTLASARLRYDEMRVRTMAGQYLDVVAAARASAGLEAILRIASLKAGAYTVAFPLKVGCSLAGGAAELEAALEAYGRPLGEAFQIRDDVLGAFGEPEVTGKDRTSDLREGKQTVLLAMARKLGSDEDVRLLDTCTGKPDLTEAETDSVREMLQRCGALDATLQVIADLSQTALRALDGAPVGDPAAHALRELVGYVRDRDQ